MRKSTENIKQLHAYWRMEYLELPKSKKNNTKLFSELPKKNEDAITLILFRGKYNYIVLNRYPYNAGHLLVIPYREVAELEEMSSEELSEHVHTIIKAKKILKQALGAQGFNIGYNFGCAAGAGITGHLHCHIVPRWEGDTNFMPVVGNTKVLPQSLQAMYKRLMEFVD